MWLCSRLLIVIAIKFIAPLVPSSVIQLDPRAVPDFTPALGWHLFTHFDGGAYKTIVTAGYDYANDGEKHNIVFFPLYPLLVYGVMTLGIPFEVAGTIVNNLGLLGAMLILYSWVEERHNINTARWVTAVLAWCPFSLFGTVTYTEGLFLLVTTAALRSFDKQQYTSAAVWGALATATRVPGAALIPAFLFEAWRERKPPIAYAAALATAVGLLLFMTYCAITFGDPLAFVHAQQPWMQQPSLHKGIRSFLNFATIFASGYLLWRVSKKLAPVAVAYGFSSLALILISGAFLSVSRFLYGNVSLSLALGVLLARYPRWGYPLMSLFAILLLLFSIRFAWKLWVA